MATTQPHTMHLVLFHSPTGRLSHSWRRENSRAETMMSLELAAYSAQRAEGACFDAIFFADKLINEQSSLNPDVASYEPITTLGALSAVTEK